MGIKDTTEYGEETAQKNDYTDQYSAEALELADELRIEETYPLAGFFLLFYGDNAPKNLIMASDSYHYYLYLQTLDGKLRLLASTGKQDFDCKENKPRTVWPWEAAELFHIDEYMSKDREVFNQVKEAGVDTLPEFPAEITKTCQKIEIIALYGPDSWLVKEKDGTLHVGRTKITLSVSDHNLHKSNKNCRLNAGFFISGNDVAKRAGKAVQFKKAG